MHVTVDPPEFHPHDEQSSDRYGETDEGTVDEIGVQLGRDCVPLAVGALGRRDDPGWLQPR